MSPAAPATRISPNDKSNKRLAAVPDSVRVIDRAQAIEAVGVSWNTWERMEERGETPPVTKLSKRRIGYRIVDLQKWLDARRQRQEVPAIEAREPSNTVRPRSATSRVRYPARSVGP